MSCARSFRKSRRCSSACAETASEPHRPDSGWALVSVLCVVALLSLMAAAVQVLVVSLADVDQRAWARTRSEAVLDAILVKAVLGITDNRREARWRVDGSEEHTAFDGHTATVRVQDQLGLIDLNAADGSMLQRLVIASGLSEDSARTLTGRILEWRSPADPNRRSAADYARQVYHPRHGPFQSVSELRLVQGMTPDLFVRLEPALTVYNGHPAFEPAIAPEAALQALYLDRPEEVSKVLSQRRDQGKDSAIFPYGAALGGRSFSVAVSLSLDGTIYRRRVVIMLTEDSRNPFLVLAWN